MELYKGTLIERIQKTPSVESFRFRPDKKLDFVAGQFLQLMFDPADPNNKELNKFLSFSSSPLHAYIEVTKRISASAFSGKLKALKKGDEVVFKAPLGSCVFKDEYKKIGFLIGGIGITPVISIIEYIVEKRLATDVCLLYSNRSDDEIAFKHELDTWKMIDDKLKICYTVTDCASKDKDCLFGPITKDVVLNKLADYRERTLFIFGPPRMVEAMEKLCLEAGCSPDSLKTETFVGY